jgi:small subunit ribosomal protein S9
MAKTKVVKRKIAKGDKKDEYVFATGKRKLAVARAKFRAGNGKVNVNSIPLALWGNETFRLWVKEPLVMAGDVSKNVDITANVRGGGTAGQAEALRIAIARGLVAFSKDKKLRDKFLEYDRNLLVYDFRRTETHKPSRSRKGARRHKQRSKR